jgi:CHAT domain-containing protein/tetratricopeptide (TPR) repeat protein
MSPRPVLVSMMFLLLTGVIRGQEPRAKPKSPASDDQARVKELHDRAMKEYGQGKVQVALSTTREALALLEKLYPKEKYPDGQAELATAWNNVGFLLMELGKYAEAKEALLRGQTMRQKLYPPEKYPQGHADLANSLDNLGLLAQRQGKVTETVKYLQQSLAINRKLYPEEKYPQGHAALAAALNNLATVYQQNGLYRQAERYHRQALAVYRKLYPHGHAHLAISLANLGWVLHEQGNDSDAEPYFREAVQQYRALYPTGHPQLAICLNLRGLNLRELGRSADAERHFRDALAMFEKFAGDQPNAYVAAALNNLGLILSDQGEMARAVRLHEKALAICEKVYPAKSYPHGHLHMVSCLTGLGRAHEFQRDFAGAETAYRKALKMTRALADEQPQARLAPVLLKCLSRLGPTLMVQGKLAEAEQLLLEAQELANKLYPASAYPDGHPERAGILSTLGLIHLRQGDLVQAEKVQREAVAMYRKLYPRTQYPNGHPSLAAGLSGLALTLQASKNDEQALPLLQEALTIRQHLFQQSAELASEAQALNFASMLAPVRHSYLAITRREKTDPAQVYRQVWQFKAALTRLLERRHLALLTSQHPEAEDLGQQLQQARQDLAQHLLAPVPATQAARDTHARQLRELNERKEQLERRLAVLLQRTHRLAADLTTTPEQLLEALPGNAAFIDLVAYTETRWAPGKLGTYPFQEQQRYTAFVLVKGQPIRRVELGEAEPIHKAWLAWRQAILHDSSERRQAQRMAQLVWAPLRKHLPDGVDTVYLAPDGDLSLLPWAALPGPGANQVLLETYALPLVLHGPFLLQQLRTRPDSKASTLLLVGGVDYDGPPASTPPRRNQVALRGPALDPSSGREGTATRTWSPLPGTTREQEMVLEQARSVRSLSPRVRKGKQASTQQLLHDLPQAQYAHLATHGFFADPKFQSAYHIDTVSFLQETAFRRKPGARNPLVLSGLILAGANRTGKQAEPDRGILTAEAIASLNLQNLQLCVLSACDTGVGSVQESEGVFGLQRAFHLAGTRNVIASLWKVDDDATAALMRLFYHHLWKEKQSPLQALRRAQLALYRHPTHINKLARSRGQDFNDTVERVSKPVATSERPLRTTPPRLWAAFALSGVGK